MQKMSIILFLTASSTYCSQRPETTLIKQTSFTQNELVVVHDIFAYLEENEQTAPKEELLKKCYFCLQHLSSLHKKDEEQRAEILKAINETSAWMKRLDTFAPGDGNHSPEPSSLTNGSPELTARRSKIWQETRDVRKPQVLFKAIPEESLPIRPHSTSPRAANTRTPSPLAKETTAELIAARKMRTAASTGSIERHLHKIKEIHEDDALKKRLAQVRKRNYQKEEPELVQIRQSVKKKHKESLLPCNHSLKHMQQQALTLSADCIALFDQKEKALLERAAHLAHPTAKESPSCSFEDAQNLMHTFHLQMENTSPQKNSSSSPRSSPRILQRLHSSKQKKIPKDHQHEIALIEELLFLLTLEQTLLKDAPTHQQELLQKDMITVHGWVRQLSKSHGIQTLVITPNQKAALAYAQHMHEIPSYDQDIALLFDAFKDVSIDLLRNTRSLTMPAAASSSNTKIKRKKIKTLYTKHLHHKKHIAYTHFVDSACHLLLACPTDEKIQVVTRLKQLEAHIKQHDESFAWDTTLEDLMLNVQKEMSAQVQKERLRQSQ